MDPVSIADRLLDKASISQDSMKEFGDSISSAVKSGQLKVIDLVKKLDPTLTNGDNSIRLRGVLILVHVITSLPKDSLSCKEIEVLQEFLNLRLVDHKSMEQPVLKCLSYFIDCNNKPEKYSKNLLECLKTKTTVPQMEPSSRLLVYDILKKILLERRSKAKTLNSDLLYSIIHMIEGENNPRNLMISFRLVSYIMKNFDELEPYIDDLFEWLASYYPIDYTPKDSEGGAIGRSDLVQALEDCFFASPLNADNLQTLMLEKLDSSPTSFKIESLENLTRCYEMFPLERIKDYASSLWTSIRMNCLKKLDTVNQELFIASYKALSAMTSKLSTDRELYMQFIIEMYEELAIAFRKPEMDLFEPATRLIVHAALPRQDGFDYILDKILPVALNAINANELRPVSGLLYMFEQMFERHRVLNLKDDITKLICSIVTSLNILVVSDVDCLRLINSLVKIKVNFDQSTLMNLKEKLTESLNRSPLDIEESLALIDISYDSPKTIDNLIEHVSHYKDCDSNPQELELSICLRRIVMTLDTATKEQLVSSFDAFDMFLKSMRGLALSSKIRSRSLENIGRLHAIILNKLPNDLADTLLMELFKSDYCQNLIPASDGTTYNPTEIYISVIKWVLKSVVLKNHRLVTPIVNLLLNYVSSEKVDVSIALATCRDVFSFVLADQQSHLFKRENHYQIFILHKQKFYIQVCKEIKTRISSDVDETKKDIMVCLLALQIPYLPIGAYRSDSEWLTRELLKILQKSRDQLKESRTCPQMDSVSIIYDSMSSFIKDHASRDLLGHIGALVELSLFYAREASSLGIRRKALSCLTDIASGLDEKELLPLRSSVVDKLRVCLSDKKRIVRQEAAAARLRWVLIGQPVGG